MAGANSVASVDPASTTKSYTKPTVYIAPAASITQSGELLRLDTLTTGLVNRRATIEARLMLGATRWGAAAPVTRDALRSALMPTINSMSATGLVSLPGMMTGQILSGVPPVEAVKYQILVMFLIAGGTGLGAVAAVIGGAYRLTDGRHRLRLDRLSVRYAAEGLAPWGQSERNLRA